MVLVAQCSCSMVCGCVCVPQERGAVTFCERVSLLQFEEQKLTTSQKALADLLDQIVADQKMSSKERSKKLKMVNFICKYGRIIDCGS